MIMPIKAENATVYYGGRRRWFTLKAAIRAEVRAKLKSRCECTVDESDFDVDHSGYDLIHCRLHEPERYKKICRRLGKIYLKAAKSTLKGSPK